MDIRILRYFLTVAREESITRAAEALYITQPTLSRQLTQLEEETGVKLLQRGPKKISLTQEGILLRRRAEEIVSLLDKTQQELLQQEEKIEGKISIGCGELASMQAMSGVFQSFLQKYPLVTFDLVTANADLAVEMMDKGLTDAALLLEPVNIEKYDFIRLHTRERWVALMRPDDPLAQKSFVTREDLESQPLILPRRPNIKNELASWFGGGFPRLHVAFTSNFNTNAAVMVMKGLGRSVTLEGAVPFWDQKVIASRPLQPELSSTTVLAWKRQQPFCLAAAKFLEHAKCLLGI